MTHYETINEAKLFLQPQPPTYTPPSQFLYSNCKGTFCINSRATSVACQNTSLLSILLDKATVRTGVAVASLISHTRLAASVRDFPDALHLQVSESHTDDPECRAHSNSLTVVLVSLSRTTKARMAWTTYQHNYAGKHLYCMYKTPVRQSPFPIVNYSPEVRLQIPEWPVLCTSIIMQENICIMYKIPAINHLFPIVNCFLDAGLQTPEWPGLRTSIIMPENSCAYKTPVIITFSPFISLVLDNK